MSPQANQATEFRRRLLTDLAIGLALILSVFAVYAQVSRFDFIGYDDDRWVYDNVHVQEGMTTDSLRWALTAVITSNWIPLTLLSHMVSQHLFGPESGLHHLVNVVFHAMSAVLLFVLLRRATGQRWPSAFVACIFALHPLSVGSVAWVSERKGILSAFCGFLGLYAYVRYSEAPNFKRYLLVAVPFCAGLLCKPMLITFPFILLLFDAWPLRRIDWPKMLWDKMPLFGLSACGSVVTYLAQQSGGAILHQGIVRRLGNAALSYVTYLGQTFCPAQLSVFYPYPEFIAVEKAVAALALIACLTTAAVLTWRTRPYIATGWFWFLGMLVPTLGLVQVGMQAHADRYMYVPMVGISIILAWSAVDVVATWPRLKPAIAAAAYVVCVLCGELARKEAAHWQDTESVFEHALESTRDNWVAHLHLAIYLASKPGRVHEANTHFAAVQRINPRYAEDSNNVAGNLIARGNCAAAIPELQLTLRVRPDYAEANSNLGVCMLIAGEYAAAVPYFEEAIRDKPDFAEGYFALGQALSKIPGRSSDAIARYEELLLHHPDHDRAHRSLGLLLAEVGRTTEAVTHLETAQRLRPEAETAGVLERLRAGSDRVRP